jgi:hypothetical protein
MRVNLQAPTDATRLSIYVPAPNEETPYLLADSQDTTWAGELPQSGYYEIVVVNGANNPITYRLNVAVDNVEQGGGTVPPEPAHPVSGKRILRKQNNQNNTQQQHSCLRFQQQAIQLDRLLITVWSFIINPLSGDDGFKD